MSTKSAERYDATISIRHDGRRLTVAYNYEPEQRFSYDAPQAYEPAAAELVWVEDASGRRLDPEEYCQEELAELVLRALERGEDL